MDTMECRHCKKSIVPKVTRGDTGMHSKICPLCGNNVENLLNQDISQITFKTSPEIGLKVLGVIIVLIVLILLFSLFIK